VAVLFRFSTLLSAPSVVLKDVVIHLALPSGQKLPEASSVSLDRFYVSCCLSTGVGGSSPLHHGFRGGPRSGSNHFRLESGFARFPPCRPFFVGSLQVQLPFSVSGPGEMFRAFSWTSPHKPLDAAAFDRCTRCCLLTAGVQAMPGSTRSVAALDGSTSLGEVLCLGVWFNASTYFRFYRPLRYIVPAFLGLEN
jgi:hypothetical protein